MKAGHVQDPTEQNENERLQGKNYVNLIDGIGSIVEQNVLPVVELKLCI